MSTMIFNEDEIIRLCAVDAEIITKALMVSKELGVIAIKDSIGGYEALLRSQKGLIAPSMDLDYRAYIVNLLQLSFEKANEEDKAIIFSTIVMPHSA